MPSLTSTHKAYVRHDGMCGVVVADKEYPVRVAFSLINKHLADFEKASQGKWNTITEDQVHRKKSRRQSTVEFAPNKQRMN